MSVDENDKAKAGKLPSDPKSGARPVTDKAKTPAERYGLLTVADLLQLAADELSKPVPRSGVSTCSEELDVAIGGFRPGNITVFGAKRGFGKSSYGNRVTLKAFSDGYRVLSFAGEDAAIMYGKRLLAALANLNAMRVRDNKVDKSDWPQIVTSIQAAPRIPYFVRTDGRPIDWVAKVIREVGKQASDQGSPVDLVIIDYLQCMSLNGAQDRRNEVTGTMAKASDATRAIGAAGLFFSQLRRTDRDEPEIEDLKESGDIEDKADHVLLGWKDEKRQSSNTMTERKIKVAKNKDGVDSNLKPVTMRWNSRTASFEWTQASGNAWLGGPPPNAYDADLGEGWESA